MADGEFSVWVFMPDETHMPLARFLPAYSAMRLAQRAVNARAGPASRAARIIITDGGDETVFEWKRGEGVTWPPPRQVT